MPLASVLGSHAARVFTSAASAIIGTEYPLAAQTAAELLLRHRSQVDRARFAAALLGLEHLVRVRSPEHRPFSALEPADRAAVLERLAEHRLLSARQLTGAIRSLAGLTAYGTTAADDTGYDGPWLGRRAIPVFSEPVIAIAALPSSAQVCVIGLGAGGCAATAVLAEAGVDVVALEAGPRIPSRQYTQRELDMLALLYEDAGLRSTDDDAITILQGHGVGGSTLHNTGLVVPPPPAILERWRTDAGFDSGTLSAHADSVIAALKGVRVTEDRINRNNQLIRSGANALGWKHYVAMHNRLECSGCGYCMIGCAYNRKVNAAFAFLPRAVAAGARIVPEARVQRIERKGTRYVINLEDGRRIECECIVLAAGAIETPALLLRSGLGGAGVGRGLRLHPAALVFARFGERVEAWRGVPQAVLVHEHATFLRDGRGGFLLMPNAATQPAFVAASMNSIGVEHRRRMHAYEHLASLAVLLHDEDGGRVRVRGGRARVSYKFSERDAAELARGIEAGASLFLAAGATEVYLPFLHRPVTSEAELVLAMNRHRVEPHRVVLNSVHPQSSCAVDAAQSSGPVRPDGRLWREKGIYIADASLFPTSVGVPPQVSVMAAARMVAETVASVFRV